jgi:Putative Tad-like Flp pilus-assembly
MRDTNISTESRVKSTRPEAKSRRGAIIVLAAIFMIAMLGMVAFALDVGYVANTNTELCRTCDAAALAGAGALVDGAAAATQAIQDYVALNPVAAHLVPASGIDIQFGQWDADTKTFTVSDNLPSAVKVVLTLDNEPLFFARAIHNNDFDTRASAIAIYQPRDIMLALDFSGSMNDDSTLAMIPTLGKNYIEGTLSQIYQDLGNPVYGTLTFAPKTAKITGMTPTNGNMAQITTEFNNDHSVSITSTKTITQVKLQFKGGATQTIATGGTGGTYRGSGSNNNKQIDVVWVKSGTNDSGNPAGSGERFADDATTLKTVFGLTNVAYPYAGDSWDNFFNYVKSNTSVANAGYRKMYGYLDWLDYLQTTRPAYSQTPDLWKVSEQPVTALKNSVTMFLNYLLEPYTGDRVGWALYTSSNQTAVVENQLSTDFVGFSDTIHHRQAGHYTGLTNIYDGLKAARLELQNNGRVGAYKMIALMTDGQANLPGSATNAKNMVIQEAYAAAAAKIPVVCITLGSGADTALMQQVADITGGVYFDIPGGQTADQYSEQLNAIWKQVADKRPLKLVGGPQLVN